MEPKAALSLAGGQIGQAVAFGFLGVYLLQPQDKSCGLLLAT
jgi:hypothetical protein